MKKFALTTAAAVAAIVASSAMTGTAYAGSQEGKIQVKLLGTAVLADGKIDRVEKDLISLPAGSNTNADNNVVPTLAVEYFFTPNVSVETICCFTEHKVTGAGALAGAELMDHVLILPATVTAKYHLPLGVIKPYVGVGVTEFFVFGERPGATAKTLGATSAKLSNTFGGVLQAGVDVPIGANGLGLSLDAKKYFVRPTAHFYAGTVDVLTTKHKLDPWVLSAGLAYRF